MYDFANIITDCITANPPKPMKQFKATFNLNGRRMETIIQAPTVTQATAMIKAQYPMATNAVSYTHLDVYKRQQPHGA